VEQRSFELLTSADVEQRSFELLTSADVDERSADGRPWILGHGEQDNLAVRGKASIVWK
jgi:hypothetical protein